MNDLFTFGLLCFTSFFTLTNPIGTMPIFITMTDGLDNAQRKKIARKATFVSFITLVVFAFSGQLLFKFFGISVNGFRIAGGIIFFAIGWNMLQAQIARVKLKEEEIKTYADDISITPLAIPLLCGPGSITNAIVLMEDAGNLWKKIILIGSIGAIYVLTYWLLRASNRITRLLGETGNNVLMRLMGLILMVIAVEFTFSGLKPILIEIIRQAHAS